MGNKSGKYIPDDIDICFHGINFAAILAARIAVDSGLKVMICLDSKLTQPFLPELISLYPIKSLFGYFKAESTFRLLQKIASFYPSLINQQRILTIIDGEKISARSLSIKDFLLKRKRDEASLPLRFSNYTQYNLLNNYFSHGALIHDYQFDRNRAILCILQECRRKGAIIKPLEACTKESVKSKFTVACIPNIPLALNLFIETGDFNLNNNVRIVNPFFEANFQKLDNGIYCRFIITKRTKESYFIEKTKHYYKSLGIEISSSDSEQLKSLFNTTLENMSLPKGNGLVYDSEFSDLTNNVRSLLKKVASVTGKKIRVNSWINELPNVLLNGDHFRRIQDECDEKYDLAKQTGINYARFCYYFYRYRESIDDFIEQVYEQMNISRMEPEILWQNTEINFIDTTYNNILSYS